MKDFWGMNLGQLIDALEASPQDHIMESGLVKPHSYRGYYDQLAFEPGDPMTVAEQLAIVKSADGACYSGYKGGKYTMNRSTAVWRAWYGDTGEEITPYLLNRVIG